MSVLRMISADTLANYEDGVPHPTSLPPVLRPCQYMTTPFHMLVIQGRKLNHSLRLAVNSRPRSGARRHLWGDHGRSRSRTKGPPMLIHPAPTALRRAATAALGVVALTAGVRRLRRPCARRRSSVTEEFCHHDRRSRLGARQGHVAVRRVRRSDQGPRLRGDHRLLLPRHQAGLAARREHHPGLDHCGQRQVPRRASGRRPEGGRLRRSQRHAARPAPSTTSGASAAPARSGCSPTATPRAST